MRIAIADIQSAAENRPPGYLESVMQAGTVEGDFLSIPAPAYTKLFAQYRGPDVPVFEQNIAAAVDKFRANCSTCP